MPASQGKERATNCLLYIGDGAVAGGSPRALTASDIAIDVTGGVITATSVANAFVTAGIVVGSQVSFSGFTDPANAFTAIVTVATAGSITLVQPVAGANRADVVPVTEAAGASVTISIENFVELLGQNNTTYSQTASDIDTRDKNSGNWASSVGGLLEMSVSVEGQVSWGDAAYTRLRDLFETNGRPNVRLLLNAGGESYYGPVSIAGNEGGGATDDMHAYSFTLNMAARPVRAVFP